jgi:hypothetical protein
MSDVSALMSSVSVYKAVATQKWTREVVSPHLDGETRALGVKSYIFETSSVLETAALPKHHPLLQFSPLPFGSLLRACLDAYRLDCKVEDRSANLAQRFRIAISEHRITTFACPSIFTAFGSHDHHPYCA